MSTRRLAQVIIVHLDDNFLRGERIRLTEVRTEDHAAIVESQRDVVFSRLLSSEPGGPSTLEQVAKMLADVTARPNAFVFAIRPVDEDRLLGFVTLDAIEWTHGVGDLGMGILQADDRGLGYGAEALSAVLQFAFRELNLHRVSLGVFEYNDRAIALYEGAGFVREGVVRQSIRRDGHRYDTLLYGLLRSEWEASLA